jgi:hypothetical protein
MTFYLALAAALGSALSLILHALGGKYPKAEKVAEAIDEAEALAAKK